MCFCLCSYYVGSVSLMDGFLPCGVAARLVLELFTDCWWRSLNVRHKILRKIYHSRWVIFFRSVETRIPEDLPMAGWKKINFLTVCWKLPCYYSFNPSFGLIVLRCGKCISLNWMAYRKEGKILDRFSILHFPTDFQPFQHSLLCSYFQVFALFQLWVSRHTLEGSLR